LIDPATRPLPPLRLAALDVFPVPADGQRLYCLRDRSDPSSAPLVVTEAALRLASLLNGERSLKAVSIAFLLQSGVQLSERQIAEFVERLDEASLLDSDAFRGRLEEQRRAFLEQPARPAIHAGGAYPAKRAELEPFLDHFFTAPDGPGAPPAAPNGRVARALIAPHIDLHRGGPTYAWTYRAMAECEPADIYLLLGTCHTSMQTPLAATRKAFETPLGPAPIAFRFLDTLESVYPGNLYEDEYSHRGEHSLEFQALYLRYLGRVGESDAAIVPLLCGSLHEWVAPGDSPREAPVVAGVIEALREALARSERRVSLVAGADLAHVGPQFGDPGRVTAGVLEAVERGDAEMLAAVCRGDADGFYRLVTSGGDPRRICGLSPIYYLQSLVGPTEGRLLKYSQWVDPLGQGSVTFAGVIFDE
jgi:AmmeMemoRadiSam system protein B